MQGFLNQSYRENQSKIFYEQWLNLKSKFQNRNDFEEANNQPRQQQQQIRINENERQLEENERQLEEQKMNYLNKLSQKLTKRSCERCHQKDTLKYINEGEISKEFTIVCSECLEIILQEYILKNNVFLNSESEEMLELERQSLREDNFLKGHDFIIKMYEAYNPMDNNVEENLKKSRIYQRSYAIVSHTVNQLNTIIKKHIQNICEQLLKQYAILSEEISIQNLQYLQNILIHDDSQSKCSNQECKHLAGECHSQRQQFQLKSALIHKIKLKHQLSHFTSTQSNQYHLNLVQAIQKQTQKLFIQKFHILENLLKSLIQETNSYSLTNNHFISDLQSKYSNILLFQTKLDQEKQLIREKLENSIQNNILDNYTIRYQWKDKRYEKVKELTVNFTNQIYLKNVLTKINKCSELEILNINEQNMIPFLAWNEQQNEENKKVEDDNPLQQEEFLVRHQSAPEAHSKEVNKQNVKSEEENIKNNEQNMKNNIELQAISNQVESKRLNSDELVLEESIKRSNQLLLPNPSPTNNIIRTKQLEKISQIENFKYQIKLEQFKNLRQISINTFCVPEKILKHVLLCKKLQQFNYFGNFTQNFIQKCESKYFKTNYKTGNGLNALSAFDNLVLFESLPVLKTLWISEFRKDEQLLVGARNRNDEVDIYHSLVEKYSNNIEVLMVGQSEGRTYPVDELISAPLLKCKNIKALCLRGIDLHEQFFLELAANNKEMTIVIIDNCTNLTEKCQASICALENLRKLALIRINHQVSLEDIKSSLECLVLESCQVKNVASIQHAITTHKLTYINLNSNAWVDDHFLQQIFTTNQYTQDNKEDNNEENNEENKDKEEAWLRSRLNAIRVVNLGNTSISNQSLILLNEMPNLGSVHLGGTSISLLYLMDIFERGFYRNFKRIEKLSLSNMKWILKEIRYNIIQDGTPCQYYNNIISNILSFMPLISHLDLSGNKVLDQRALTGALPNLLFANLTENQVQTDLYQAPFFDQLKFVATDTSLSKEKSDKKIELKEEYVRFIVQY